MASLPLFFARSGEMGEHLRVQDWAATPLGRPETWPLSLRAALQLMFDSKHGMCLVWGPELTLFYNEAYAPFLGLKHPWALGRPFAEVWSDIWAEIEPLVRAALGGEALWLEDFHLVMERNGYPEDTWWSFSYSPVRDEEGVVRGMLNVASETTGKVLTERRQAFRLTLEEQLRGIEDPREATLAAAGALGRHLRASRVGYCEVEADGLHLTVAGEWRAPGVASVAGRHRLIDYGLAFIADYKAGRTVSIVDCRTDPRVVAASAVEAFEALGIRAQIMVPLVRDGRLAALFFLQADEVRHWSAMDIALAEDVAERSWVAVEHARIEAALREREERLRLIVENVRDYAIFTSDLADRIDTWLPGAARVFGWSQEEIVGQSSALIFTPEDRAAGVPAAEVAQARRQGFAPNVRWHLRRDGTRAFIEGSMTALRNADGSLRGFLHIGQDVTERRAAEERQALLAREVDHRAKNALAVVQAALRLTRAPDMPAYVKAIEGRVGALARAHSALAQDRWAGADLRVLLEGELAPFLGPGTEAGPRASLQGPRVSIPAGAAQPLAMAVHELATNAVKHGALSVPTGRISFSWSLGEGSGRPTSLRLHWVETGGPPVGGAPGRQGFGSRILEGTVRGQLGGTVTLFWDPAGLVCKMEIPLGAEAGAGIGDADEGRAQAAD